MPLKEVLIVPEQYVEYSRALIISMFAYDFSLAKRLIHHVFAELESKLMQSVCLDCLQKGEDMHQNHYLYRYISDDGKAAWLDAQQYMVTNAIDRRQMYIVESRILMREYIAEDRVRTRVLVGKSTRR